MSFEEAKLVFYDDFAIEYFDDNHAELEDRFLLLGMSQNSRLLFVCHCFRDKDEVIRIISARKATRNESTHHRSAQGESGHRGENGSESARPGSCSVGTARAYCTACTRGTKLGRC